MLLKKALGFGEHEPARLRATVNNAVTLHPSSLCQIGNTGGERCERKDAVAEDKLREEFTGGHGFFFFFFPRLSFAHH